MHSALARRLKTYLDLTTTESETLDWLERRRRALVPGERLVREGEANNQLFVVTDGWLHSSIRLASSERQILQLHFPGDLIGLSSLAWNQSGNTITAIGASSVASFDQSDLAQVFRHHPRLAALLYTVAAAEQVAMSDRLASLGQTDALARIAALILDIVSRMRIAAPAALAGNRVDLQLTQTDIGAATGLTKVHVNRVLRRMEEEGLIGRQGRTVELLDEPRLVKVAAFRDRMSHIATAWLPSATPRSMAQADEAMAAQ